MKNQSTSSTKGKPWGHPCKGVKEGYNQVGGEGHKSSIGGHFLGGTKGNRDLPTNRTSGVSTGHGGGLHKAGG